MPPPRGPRHCLSLSHGTLWGTGGTTNPSELQRPPCSTLEEKQPCELNPQATPALLHCPSQGQPVGHHGRGIPLPRAPRAPSPALQLRYGLILFARIHHFHRDHAWIPQAPSESLLVQGAVPGHGGSRARASCQEGPRDRRQALPEHEEHEAAHRIRCLLPGAGTGTRSHPGKGQILMEAGMPLP